MSVRSTFELPKAPLPSPLDLIDTAQVLPIYEEDCIPVYVAGKFPLVTPRIQAIGENAVRMTVNDKPFWFRQGQDGIPFQGTQLMDDIVLESQETKGSPWLVTVETPDPTDAFDTLIILEGLHVYIGSAARKLRRR